MNKVQIAFALVALCVLAPQSALAVTLQSHDIGDYISADQINGVMYPRYKIVTGDPGTENDVGPSNPLPVSSTAGGKVAVQFVRNVYSSTNVTTGAYVQLIASTSGAATEIEIFDSSGQTLKIAVGGVGTEVDQIIDYPGGNGRVPLAIPAGSRVSIRAISGTASTGEIDINLYR